MSYTIGQYRSNSSDAYVSNASFNYTIGEETSSTDFGIVVEDTSITLTNAAFEANKCYYLRIKIKPKTIKQDIIVALRGNTDPIVQQYIKSFSIPALSSESTHLNDFILAEMVFKPNSSNYDRVMVFLQRNFVSNPTELIQVQVEVTEADIREIYNVISFFNPAPSELKKIGVQGPGGMLMCINGEEIRVHPNGIYQIRNGYQVNFLGFVILPNDVNNNHFILDYQY